MIETTVERELLTNNLQNKFFKALSFVVVLLVVVSVSDTSAQDLAVVKNGLRMQVMAENSRPTLKVWLPSSNVSGSGIEIIFPEHVTVREHGQHNATHLYLWWPGRLGDMPQWQRIGQSLEYTMDLKGRVRMLARATLEPDGVLVRYEFLNRSTVDFDMLQAVTDPRFYRSGFRDVRLERTYVHRKEGFALLASDTPARLTMPLNQWLPCRYLDSFTWPVPSPDRRVLESEGITYYNASRPVDEPFIATISKDGRWVAATCSLTTGNVWTNPRLTCQHADPEICLRAGATAWAEEKIFIFEGSLKEALGKVRNQRHRWAVQGHVEVR